MPQAESVIAKGILHFNSWLFRFGFVVQRSYQTKGCSK